MDNNKIIKIMLKERKQALLSMDEKEIRLFFRKYNNKEMPSGAVFWLIVHKARTGATDLPEWERAASKSWLYNHGSEPLDDGDVYPLSNLAEYFKRMAEFEQRDFTKTEFGPDD